MSKEKDIYFGFDYPTDDIRDKQILLGEKGKKIKKNLTPDSIGSEDPEDYNMAILDQSGNCKKKFSCCKEGCVQHFRKPRKPLSEHPLNTTYNEDVAEVASKGLMIGGTAIVAKGVGDALGGPFKPIFTGATLVGAGTLLYKLTDQDIKKFYRNYQCKNNITS